MLMLLVIASCSNPKRENVSKKIVTPVDSSANTGYDDYREQLPLKLTDTVKREAAYYFSNTQTKDRFLLTIAPGSVSHSTAELRIIASDNRIIYTQQFDASYFLVGILEPDSIPLPIAPDAHGQYISEYRKSLTLQQYQRYFNKKVDSFFNGIHFIKRNELDSNGVDGVDLSDNEFWKEVKSDTSIQLISVACYDCDEGGSIIGYSRSKNKVMTIFEWD